MRFFSTLMRREDLDPSDKDKGEEIDREEEVFEVFVMPDFHHRCDDRGQEDGQTSCYIVWTEKTMSYHIGCRVVGVVEVDILHIQIRDITKSCLHIKRIDRDIVEIDLVMFDHSPIDQREKLLR